MLLKCKGTLFPKPYQIVQAEFVSLSSDAVAEYDIQNIGFAGNGYVKLPSHEGAYITWEQLDGKEGGEHIIRIRYSLEDNRQASHILTVNGKSYRINWNLQEEALNIIISVFLYRCRRGKQYHSFGNDR